jgi:hypothetical protein
VARQDITDDVVTDVERGVGAHAIVAGALTITA